MAAFSNASSAYIRFSFTFSASSSFSRLSSATLVPAYFDRQLKYVARLNAVLPHQVRDRDPRLAFLQDANDLTLREPGLPHGDSFQSARESNILRSGNRGSVPKHAGRKSRERRAGGWSGAFPKSRGVEAGGGEAGSTER